MCVCVCVCTVEYDWFVDEGGKIQIGARVARRFSFVFFWVSSFFSLGVTSATRTNRVRQRHAVVHFFSFFSIFFEKKTKTKEQPPPHRDPNFFCLFFVFFFFVKENRLEEMPIKKLPDDIFFRIQSKLFQYRLNGLEWVKMG